MSIFKELKDRKLTASDKLIFLFLSKNKNSTYVEICQQLELSINTVKAGLKKLKECNLIEREKEGRKRGTKIVLCQSDENLIWYKICTIFTSNFYNGTKFVPYYTNDNLLLNSDSYTAIWYKNCTMLWELERKEAKERYIYINTYINSININIISIEGKSSLTTFASTSLKYYIGKFNFVNDPDHKELNSVHNSLIPTEPAKTDLAEIVKAPAKRKRAKAQFIPPTVEEVTAYMKEVKAERIIKHPNLQFFNVEDQAENYMDHYGAEHHWYKGKEPMKDWKAAVRIWVRNFKGAGTYTTKRRKNQDAIEEIFGKGLEPETNIIDAVQTENADGSVSYDASLTNQIQPAEEAELSADEYIRRFKKGEIK